MTTEILQAILDHAAAGHVIRPSSPLLAMIADAVAHPSADATPAPAAPSSSPRLPVRPGLTDAEKAARRATLGSSEIAAVVGVNPYASVHSVWSSKCLGVDFEGNEATTLGNLLEPTIFAIYADRYDRVLRKGVYTIGPEPWMAATPDAYIEGTDGLVEAKLVGLRSIYQWGAGNTDESESDAIPLHYMCQAQWQMACTGASFVDVSALMGTEFRSYTIRSNVDIQKRLIDRGREFWMNHVVTQTPPPVDGSEGAKDMLKVLYPRSGAPAVKATPDLEAAAEALRAARAAFDAAEFAKAKCENEIKAALGEAGGAYGDGWRVRYSTTKAGKRPFCFDDEREKEGRAA